jgi:hypothetical protein
MIPEFLQQKVWESRGREFMGYRQDRIEVVRHQDAGA